MVEMCKVQHRETFLQELVSQCTGLNEMFCIQQMLLYANSQTLYLLQAYISYLACALNANFFRKSQESNSKLLSACKAVAADYLI